MDHIKQSLLKLQKDELESSVLDCQGKFYVLQSLKDDEIKI